jgi:hypothetical protein
MFHFKFGFTDVVKTKTLRRHLRKCSGEFSFEAYKYTSMAHEHITQHAQPLANLLTVYVSKDTSFHIVLQSGN